MTASKFGRVPDYCTIILKNREIGIETLQRKARFLRIGIQNEYSIWQNDKVTSRKHEMRIRKPSMRVQNPGMVVQNPEIVIQNPKMIVQNLQIWLKMRFLSK